MQDIVPKSRSIRNIPIPPERARKEESNVVPIKKAYEKVDKLTRKLEREDLHLQKEISHLKKEESHIEALRRARAEFEMHNSGMVGRRGLNKKKIWVGGALSGVVGLAIIISTVFHGASVTVSPKVVAANVGGDYTAKKSAAKGELAFDNVSLKQTGTEIVKATGEKVVNKAATGAIVIYNNYGATSQRLIKNTRFETPEGLIYRISDSVTVPGKSGSTPGSIEAVVTADEVGEKYNAGLKDFTIPGFKGDPRYGSFYARSKTPLSGGFSGKRKVIADADRKKAEENIKSKLKTTLIEEVKKQIAPDRLFFDKSYSVDFVSLPEETTAGSDVVIKMEGVISAAVFDKNAFSSYLAGEVVKGYQGDAVAVRDPQSIFFTPKSDFRPGNSASISFSLSGTALFEWIYDETTLRDALRNTDREGIVSILQKFPMIEKADISIRPFWRGSFPDSADRIIIKKAE